MIKADGPFPKVIIALIVSYRKPPTKIMALKNPITMYLKIYKKENTKIMAILYATCSSVLFEGKNSKKEIKIFSENKRHSNTIKKQKLGMQKMAVNGLVYLNWEK